MDGPAPSSAAELDVTTTGRFRSVLERRSDWIEILIGLATLVAFFVVLDFLSRYFANYLRIILIFFFAWLLAFLMSPAADWLQRRLTRLPRPVAVVAVLVPIIVIGAIVVVKVLSSIAESLVSLAAALPAIAANPPPILDQIQAWFNQQGIAVDVAGTFQSLVHGLLQSMVDGLAGLVGGVVASVGSFVDAIIVVSLAVFMAIDRDKILRFGLDLTPPDKRDDAIMFRHSVASAAAGLHPQPAGARCAVRRLGAADEPRVRAAFAAASRRDRRADHDDPDLRPVRLLAAAGPRRAPRQAGRRGPGRDRHARRLVHRREHSSPRSCAPVPSSSTRSW
jgi:hypothetical protein